MQELKIRNSINKYKSEEIPAIYIRANYGRCLRTIITFLSLPTIYVAYCYHPRFYRISFGPFIAMLATAGIELRLSRPPLLMPLYLGRCFFNIAIFCCCCLYYFFISFIPYSLISSSVAFTLLVLLI